MSQGFAQPPRQKASRRSNPASVSEVSKHLQGYFSEIEDPRVQRSRAHELMDILMISILAVMAGALMLGGHRDIRVEQASLVGAVFSLAQRYSVS